MVFEVRKLVLASDSLNFHAEVSYNAMSSCQESLKNMTILGIKFLLRIISFKEKCTVFFLVLCFKGKKCTLFKGYK